MKVRFHMLSTFVARGIAAVCPVLLVVSAPSARAGIDAFARPCFRGGAPVTALAIDPAAPRTLYAAPRSDTDVTGVFKSTDGGRSWQAVNAGLPNNPYVNALAIDPITPRTLYVGTGGGVFKSTDGATTWQDTSLPVAGANAFAIDPSVSGTLYTGAVGGVYKSTDGAITWRPVLTANANTPVVRALVIDPTAPSTLYAGTTDCRFGPCRGGVYKSADGAGSWAVASTGLPSTGVLALALDPTTPGMLYAGSYTGGVFKSTDGGSTWNAVNMGLPGGNTAVYALAIDPTLPRTLYAGTDGTGVFKSTDGATSWRAVNTGLTNLSLYVLALAIDPTTPNMLYAATNGGLFKSTDGATTWQASGFVLDAALCGDGIRTCGEECDDGNTVSGDGCDANCTVTRCGNGITTASEECDDGNNNPSDGCTNGCTICGNGIVTPPEECEAGNTNRLDGCTNACTICGNGVVTPPEECDDGNLVNGDGCEANCQTSCGNGVREGDEECDDGGTCIGSANAGTQCAADTDCQGGHCQTFGGDGCAANCTLESDVAFGLVPGVFQVPAPGTSGAEIHTDLLTLPLPFSGSQTLTIGKERAGHIPVVIKAAAVHLARVSFPSSFFSGGCFCPRAVAAKTCGGTVFEPDGMTQSPDCTPGFTAGDSVCAGKHPCTFLHGPGNSASGVIGCDGLYGVNVSLTQDSGGSSGTPRPPLLTLSSTGIPGSAVLFATTAIGGGVCQCGGHRGLQAAGSLTQNGCPGCPALCTGQDASVYGPDGEFCTDDDPQSQRGSPLTVPVTTGTASGAVFNANGIDANDIGPFSATGHPFSCSALASGSASGAALASVSVELARQMGDDVTTNLLVAAPTSPCVGDCHSDGQVTIDELLTMVNIALGAAQPSACAHGVPSGADVNVALIIQAVNGALNGCTVGR